MKKEIFGKVLYCSCVIILVYFDKLWPACSTVQALTSVLFAHVDTRRSNGLLLPISKTEFKDKYMAIYIVILTIVIFIDFLIIDDVVSNVKLLT